MNNFPRVFRVTFLIRAPLNCDLQGIATVVARHIFPGKTESIQEVTDFTKVLEEVETTEAVN